MKGFVPSKKKIPFKLNEPFQTYLKRYTRATTLPIQYEDLLRSNTSVSLLDAEGNDTLWETVYYEESDRMELDSIVLLVIPNLSELELSIDSMIITTIFMSKKQMLPVYMVWS